MPRTEMGFTKRLKEEGDDTRFTTTRKQFKDYKIPKRKRERQLGMLCNRSSTNTMDYEIKM
uniref:Putative ovule protein n=1 Tax=Solanum chacoense TaxID=4108 RepID=A0A0V0HB74_SOLCH